MGAIFYELKPFLCLASGLVSLANNGGSALLWIGAMLLLTSGTMITLSRMAYRGYLN